MIAPARRVSYQILLQMAAADAHSDELLRLPEVDALSAQDRHLTTTLVMGTLRWQLALDARITALLARPGTKLSAEAATALRMGAYQLLHLDRVPAHAVIHDGVELVKQGHERGAAGMVNAVLRKIAEQRAAVGDRRSDSAGQTFDAVAARWAHPAWMVERWVQRYGLQAAEAICRWDQEPPMAVVRVDPGIEITDIETEPGHFLTWARCVVHSDLEQSAAFGESRIRVQDEGSQLVGEIAAAAVPPAQRVLDACAAPGGKTAILTERLPQAEITAMDVSRKRLDAMQNHFAGSRAVPIQFEVADATRLQLEPGWDLILCDVPCSGTGTMARNPEIRLRVTEADLARQHRRQVAILRASLMGLKPGGRLVYSTCSLEPEENEEVVAEVLETVPGFSVVPIEEILEGLVDHGVLTADGRERLKSAAEGGFLRTLPGVHPCDGFFAAVLERQPAGQVSGDGSQ